MQHMHEFNAYMQYNCLNLIVIWCWSSQLWQKLFNYKNISYQCIIPGAPPSKLNPTMRILVVERNTRVPPTRWSNVGRVPTTTEYTNIIWGTHWTIGYKMIIFITITIIIIIIIIIIMMMMMISQFLSQPSFYSLAFLF